MKQNRNILRALTALLCVVALFGAIYLITRPAPEPGVKQICVEVVHSDGTETTFTYRTDAEYLGEVLTVEGLVQGEQGEFGLYITEVDGEQTVYEKDGAYWAFYQDGEYAQQGVDQTPIRDGDSFRLVYTYG